MALKWTSRDRRGSEVMKKNGGCRRVEWYDEGSWCDQGAFVYGGIYFPMLLVRERGGGGGTLYGQVSAYFGQFENNVHAKMAREFSVTNHFASSRCNFSNRNYNRCWGQETLLSMSKLRFCPTNLGLNIDMRQERSPLHGKIRENCERKNQGIWIIL